MISHFFIDRPIFAAVLSIVIVLTGSIAGLYLPIAQYPQITPPAVAVTINYPGASAQVVSDTVAAPIEQQVNGVEGMLYMSSQMGNDGSYTLTVTFDLGTDLNTALVMVQNRVALAMPQLPNSVQLQGITIKKKTPDLLLIVSFYSPDGRYDDIYLSNFATINVKDELFRVDGVSDITYLGQRDYSIRVWLDPQRLAACNMAATDVADAIRAQNLQIVGGQIGNPPAPRGQSVQLPLAALGRLSEPEQFADIIIKAAPDTAPLRAPVSTTAAVSPPSAGTAAGGNSTSSPGSLGGGLKLSGMLPTLQLPSSQSTSSSLSSGSSAASGTVTAAGTIASSVNSGNTGSSSSGTLGGGASTGGGATATGGGTTGGGATAGGGATTGGAATNAGTVTLLTNQGPTAPSGSTSSLTQGGASLAMMSVGGGTSISGLSPTPVSGLTQNVPRPTSQSLVRLRDVARVEMGAQNYNMSCTLDGRPSVGLAIHQLPGTNALDVAARIKKKMEELAVRFPDGLAYTIAYDTTPYIQESVADVVQTLFEAVVLVAIVVLAFLQNWRAIIIPLLAVPVAIIGTFAAMAPLNFSLNNISLFGLVLAIGIVVDDAIVVVENVERWLEEGFEPREATRRAMDEVTGPVIAVALVLSAVFVPCAFISGITGQFFRQFALTIAVSTMLSAFNSLTLSPALAAILLRPRKQARDPLTRLLDLSLGWFFRLFNGTFSAASAGYGWLVSKLVRASALVLLGYAGLGLVTWLVFSRAPTGFIPEQDQGRLIVNVQLPDSASLERTKRAIAQIEKITRETPGVAHTTTVSGLSFVQQADSSNFGSLFVILEPFAKRRSPELRDTAIMARLRRAWAREVKEAVVIPFRAPAIPGLSVAGGFKLMVEDRAGLGLPNLQQHADRLIQRLRKAPGITGVSTQFRSDTPQLYMDIDRTKAASLGCSVDDVDQTLQIYLGSLYVNSFNAFGRYWQVTLQAEGNFRDRIADVNLLQVRNNQGQMVLLGTLVNVREIGGPVFVLRYNLYTAAPVTGNLRPGASSGDVIREVDQASSESLPLSMATEWTELMFMQIRAGNTAMIVFALSVVCVFLALAALYESWSLPLAVILVVPLCLLCSVVGVLYTKNVVNIFVQIGLVVLVGLACKNSILIVEFARQLHEQGKDRYEATIEASRLRLRPILMTSFAFILGVVPLVVASGAGAEMRRSLGTAVFSGMIGVTLFGIFLTPVFFYVIQGISSRSPLPTGAPRQLTSVAICGLLGAGSGYLLARTGAVQPLWAGVVGGSAGLIGSFAVIEIRRRALARRKQGPPPAWRS